MAENDQNQTDSFEKGFDPSIQSEKLGFDPGQMVTCTCGRSNPPNRIACLYCGTVLEIERFGSDTIRPGLRRPDPWEHGFNLVTNKSSTSDVDLTGAAYILSLAENDLKTILENPLPLPLYRVQGEGDAVAIHKVLSDHGLDTAIVSDLALSQGGQPIRVRAISFAGSGISMKSFDSKEEFVIPTDDLVLLVEGTITISKVDQMEKRRRGGVSQVLDEVSTISDEPVLDIYSRQDEVGYRVFTSGFDFSCLGEEKGLLASDNLKLLTSKLASLSTNAKLVHEYRSVRQSLGCVWEPEIRKDSKGLQRTGFGKREFGSVMTTSNLEQFTKFSRLQRHLL